MSIPAATRDIFKKYCNIRGKHKNEFPFPYWDIVVLTASDKSQKDAYEQQIADKLMKGELPKGIPYLVFADPVGPKVGCGGSTFHIISELHNQYKEELWNMKVLLMNAGGQSQRLPSASVLGKIFTPLPCGNPMYQVFDLKLASYIPFIAKMKPGIFHAAADTIEVFDLGSENEWSFTQPGFTSLAHPSSLEIGATHGVYVLEEDGPPTGIASMRNCIEVLQKPSIDKMYAKNAVLEHQDNTKFVYTDSCFFFDHTISKLFLEFYTKYKPLKCEIDAYGDFLQALGSAASDAYTCDTKNVARVEPILIETRKNIYNLLKGTQLNVLALQVSKFYHLGTAEEYIHNFCSNSVLAEEMGFQRNIFVAFAQETPDSESAKKRKLELESGGCIVHSQLQGGNTFVAKTAIVEYCDFDVPINVQANTLLNNCSFLHNSTAIDCPVPMLFDFPPNVCMHTVPIVKEGLNCMVTIVYNISDNIKKSVSREDISELKWLGKPLVQIFKQVQCDVDSVFSGSDKCSLWNAKLFPVCHSYSDSFLSAYNFLTFSKTDVTCRLSDFLNCERISLRDAVVTFKDSKAILDYRNALYNSIKSQQ